MILRAAEILIQQFFQGGMNMLKETLNLVYDTMKPMGYDPIDRMKDYILYGDPSYITAKDGARNKMSEIDRDELLTELLKSYLNK